MIEDYLRKNEIAYFLKNVVSFIRFWLNLNRIYKYGQRVTINRISSHVSFSIIIFRKFQQVFFCLSYQYQNYPLFITLKNALRNLNYEVLSLKLYPIHFLYMCGVSYKKTTLNSYIFIKYRCGASSNDSTPHQQLFNLHCVNLTSSLSISIHLEIEPLDNNNIIYLLIYKFDQISQLNSSTNQIDGWTILNSSKYSNIHSNKHIYESIEI